MENAVGAVIVKILGPVAIPAVVAGITGAVVAAGIAGAAVAGITGAAAVMTPGIITAILKRGINNYTNSTVRSVVFLQTSILFQLYQNSSGRTFCYFLAIQVVLNEGSAEKINEYILGSQVRRFRPRISFDFSKELFIYICL